MPIVGEYLSEVTFVMDYVQLVFNGPCLTALVLPTVHCGGREWSATDPGWRDSLCARIGGTVSSACLNGEELGICFEDGSRITVSLKEAHRRGAEAINFTAPGQPLVVC